MDFYKLFYLFTMADKLSNLWCTFVWIFSIACILGTLFVVFEKNEKDKATIWTLSGFYLLCFISWVLYIGTPTKKEAVIIIAGGYIGNFIQSDTNARQLPADITRFLRSQINLAAQENNLSGLLGKSQQEVLQDSLRSLSKEQLINLLAKPQ